MQTFPVADCSEVTYDNGLPVLGAGDLINVETVGRNLDAFLQLQLAANQSPLFCLWLDHCLTQSESTEIKRCHMMLNGYMSK